MKLTIPLTLICLLAGGACAVGSDEVPSADQRFGDAGAEEVPHFRRHVVPLLGKLGCNGRACHGSFQGRGGFRLSLFGYDFKMDHEELYGRLDDETPVESLILKKPTLGIPHEGGRRMKADGWEYRILHNWVAGGAEGVPENRLDLVKLDVTPSEVQFRSDAEEQQLKVVAVWSDGTREDVTPLCRFRTNDEQVAEVADGGLISAGSPGDTHVVVFYDAGVVPIPVVRPVTDKIGKSYPIVKTRTRVDELVVGKLRKLGIVPSEVCTDAEFLRRASLDVTGTLPTPGEIEEFLADTSADKRTRKIAELLERPGYVAWWTTKLCDFTGNSDDALVNVVPENGRASQDWYSWISKRVEANVPYDKIVEGIVLGTSREPGESYEEFCETMSGYYDKDSNGSFADRSTMPHYWARRTFRQPEDRAIGFAYTFLGTRIQCAQCHKHPFDQWTQDDFKQFQAFFTRTTFGRDPQSRDAYNKMIKSLDMGELRGGELRRKVTQLLRDGKTVPFQEVFAAGPRNVRRRRNQEPPAVNAKPLGGEVVNLNDHKDVRAPLMEWLRDSPLFARAYVNRVWAGYFNRGIVDPPDDMSLANPPVNAELLEHLTKGFVASDFDMKWLHREILNSDTYQRSWRANDTNRLDESNFSRAVPRRLPAEVAVDAIAQATAGNAKNASLHTDLAGRTIAIPGAGRRVRSNREAVYALTIFGRSTRESNCDCDRSMEPSLLQTVFLRNDAQTLGQIDARDGWLAEIAKEAGIRFQPQAATGGRVSPQQLERARAQVKRMKESISRLRKQGNKERAAQLQKQLSQMRSRYGRAIVDPPKRNVEEPVAGDVEPDHIVRQAYLRTLSRLPSDEEQTVALAHLKDAPDVVQGTRDLLWALINTKEFIVNH